MDKDSPYAKYNIRQINTYICQNRAEDTPKMLKHANNMAAQQIVAFSLFSCLHPNYNHFAYKLALEVADTLNNSKQKDVKSLRCAAYDPVDHHVADEDIKWIQYHLFDTMGSNSYDWFPTALCNWFSPDYNDANSFSEVAQREFGFPSGMTELEYHAFVQQHEFQGSEFNFYYIGEVSEMRRKAKIKAGPDNL